MKKTAYINEDGVNPESLTETFVALKLWIDNWRWSGVPFFLRTGKRMAEKKSEIVVGALFEIKSKKSTHSLFGIPKT